jgi:hypothetical protein
VLDPHVVRKQARDVPLEAVELRQRVLPDREQEVHAQVRVVHDCRELAGEGALVLLGRVVEEVVLELVEDDEQGAHRLGPGAQRVRRRLAREPRTNPVGAGRFFGRGLNRLHQRRQRIVAPGRKRADGKRCPLEPARRLLAREVM